MNLQRLCLRFAMGLVIALITVGATLILVPKYRQTLHLRAERERLEHECANLEILIDDLHRKQQRFRVDPDFVEHIARQNRRVRPDEIVFVIPAAEDVEDTP